MSEPFIAQIKIFAGNFAPRGWAFCDGHLLPIAQNSALFSLLGTIYGGDGRTNFALPDLRGSFPLHPGSGAGLRDRSLGEVGGQATVTLSEAQIPSHRHLLQASGSPAQTGTPSSEVLLAQAVEVLATDPGTGAELTEPRNVYGADPGTLNRVEMADGLILPAGGSLPHEDRHPYLALNFVIALQGIFPSRN